MGSLWLRKRRLHVGLMQPCLFLSEWTSFVLILLVHALVVLCYSKVTYGPRGRQMASDETRRPIYNPLASRVPTPLARINWICQWIVYVASGSPIFKALEYVGKLAILVALYSWFADIPEQRRTAIRTAWSVVNAKGGGRKEGLKFLSERDVDLRGLSGAGGYFAHIDLTNKDLSWSDLADANFDHASLAFVKLRSRIRRAV
jgi:hypothetical protein